MTDCDGSGNIWAPLESDSWLTDCTGCLACRPCHTCGGFGVAHLINTPCPKCNDTGIEQIDD